MANHAAAKATFQTIAAYRFVRLNNLATRRQQFYERGRALELKGTILLAPEGINLFLAGRVEAIRDFVTELRAQPEFAGLPIKFHGVEHQPFNRLLVRLKNEIIPLGRPEICPEVDTIPRLTPRELKALLDEGREVVLLDVRNDYEIEVGTFVGAHAAGIRHFRDFPQAMTAFPEEWKQRPIVMFCTGGIRCEKAGLVMQQAGYHQVRQLDGGILKYFEDCGGAHYRGDCFVFDQRVAVNPDLRETETAVCFHCQAVLTPADQKRSEYNPPHSCHRCYRTPQEVLADTIFRREAALQKVSQPLPGSQPYDNIRPINVPARLDGAPVIEVLTTLLGHWGATYWRDELVAGRIYRDGHVLGGGERARAGWRIEHHIPHTREPDVSADIRIVYEDEWIVAVDKPAPLPMHPCGRFNRNTLTYLLNAVYRPEVLRPAHRLDADTSGLVLFSRNRQVARRIQPQFEQNQVEKWYWARVSGHPLLDHFVCDQAISDQPAEGGRRVAASVGGQAAHTEFRVITRHPDGTASVECRPITGRTNQIRIHLAISGHPIVGDRVYGQALPTDDGTGDDATQSIGHSPLKLHAARLAFKHPFTEQRIEIESTRFCAPY